MALQIGKDQVGIAKQAGKGTIAANPAFAHGVTGGGIKVDVSQEADAVTSAYLAPAGAFRDKAENGADYGTRAWQKAMGLYLLAALGNVATTRRRPVHPRGHAGHRPQLLLGLREEGRQRDHRRQGLQAGRARHRVGREQAARRHRQVGRRGALVPGRLHPDHRRVGHRELLHPGGRHLQARPRLGHARGRPDQGRQDRGQAQHRPALLLRRHRGAGHLGGRLRRRGRPDGRPRRHHLVEDADHRRRRPAPRSRPPRSTGPSRSPS